MKLDKLGAQTRNKALKLDGFQLLKELYDVIYVAQIYTIHAEDRFNDTERLRTKLRKIAKNLAENITLLETMD
jgi:hypothetical protein